VVIKCIKEEEERENAIPISPEKVMILDIKSVHFLIYFIYTFERVYVCMLLI